MITPFDALERAIDIVNTSTHSTNRIAATIFHETNEWHFSCVNHWPTKIEKALGRDTRIGDASGTIHAETACIFHAAFEEGYSTQGTSLAITDPPCPNCVKNMAEAGIDNIYIDHKGFHKDFAQRRLEYFKTLSLRLAEKAGVSIYEVNRKTKSIVPIIIADKEYVPPNENPIEIIEEEENFKYEFSAEDHIKVATAILFKNNQKIQMICTSHPALGFQTKKDLYEIEHPETKYSFIQEACNRLLMNAARYGYKILENRIICSETPTSREFVNLVGANIDKLKILNPEMSRDNDSNDAKAILIKHGIIVLSE